ncbi:similar to Saccharomyces cerevisiae YMR053C STB2 Protein that interacts with Sin3p in a two-hybrid assay and is part of a large protein complex with Sin3p and Stb1p [Maudiozyma saulgeensis]|uniref:Similar to Saccharomyces cerevisiae YMR053C STB2 Protein that interacts with Sin3p in a two-hybrid assay and is part of a large protein complex with Sin3p and Stb1p n=1 Tax=Maudiozyma saulgeensis TaxID=1789683 RepID=A0A1X7QX49_9SACH|nr:similar to Saccharomyces cerevisiae YMR053C STB2 Protein that interacts with Sin3p in a two-hybrid assay and is part of a large protein complex with Sin3p and Stb1p [Kazachstania saulgeensis]
MLPSEGDTTSGWKSFVFPDFKALNDLCLQRSRDLAYEEVQIHGFEIYIVEQWTEERKISSLITSYTGNSQDTVTAVRICLPSDYHYWPQNFKNYLKELQTYSQAKVINGDTLFITNLSSISSTLNFLNVDCGDLRTVWDNYRTNFNLKKLNCGGRSALLLKGPTSAALNKFAQLYKIQLRANSTNGIIEENSNNDSTIYNNQMDDKKLLTHQYRYCPVTELVSLVQITLNYFAPNSCVKRVDGLLCNNTRKAIDNWWAKYGKFYLGIDKPKNEVIMGPTTVASLFSLLLTCYFKLIVEGSMSAKDPFDEDEFYSGIYVFQKKHNISKQQEYTYLDPLTLQTLFEVSAKSSNNDIFNLKKVVKSTMQDFAGKGNFMHLSNEILTSDLSILVRNIHSGTLAALWKGKGETQKSYHRRKSTTFVNKNFNHGDPIARIRERYNLQKISSIDPADMDQLYPYALKKHEAVFDTKSIAGDTSSETSSTSSMINNYDTVDSEENVELDNTYRREFYRRNSIPFVLDGTKTPVQNDALKRRNSVSEIADNLEKWNMPFNVSVVRIARDLKRINTLMSSNDDSNSYDFDVSPLYVTQTRNNDESLVFKDSIKKMANVCEQYNKDRAYLEPRERELEMKQTHLQKEMEEINILTSRFKYNIRILHARIKEVETNVNRFDSKLNEIDLIISKNEYPIKCEVDPNNDREGFEEYIVLLNAIRKNKYRGLSWKVLSTELVKTGQEVLKSWYNWIFKS